MNDETSIYKPSLALLTDLYQITMAAGYWHSKRNNDLAVFHLYFRTPAAGSGYTIAAGLETALNIVQNLHFDEQDLAFLAKLTGNDKKPLFVPEFLKFLSDLKYSCDIDAVEEGTIVFPNEPLMRVTGPILQAQLLETILLNIINFQTLIATKAARVCQAAEWDPVVELGLRRAQGIDGGLSASRACYIGGCVGTSNVLAGRLYNIPVKGTIAHSWVVSFEDELSSFEAYADALPNNCTFLVDTFNTIQGIKNAIIVALILKRRGHSIAGIRIDSGDLVSLSIIARKMLDEAELTDAKIVASNDLDEKTIEHLKARGAKINIWGVGTALVTGGNRPALGGVYKLGAISRNPGSWEKKIKISEQKVKTTLPGILAFRRFEVDGKFIGDQIYSLLDNPTSKNDWRIVDPNTSRHIVKIPIGAIVHELLVPVIRNGVKIYNPPTLETIRERVRNQLNSLPYFYKFFIEPEDYPVGVSSQLATARRNMIDHLS